MRPGGRLCVSRLSILAAYLDGPRNRLHASSVHMLTIMRGVADSALTPGKTRSELVILRSPSQAF
jgi:hypothetical protein